MPVIFAEIRLTGWSKEYNLDAIIYFDLKKSNCSNVTRLTFSLEQAFVLLNNLYHMFTWYVLEKQITYLTFY